MNLKIKWRQHEILASALLLAFYALQVLSRDSDMSPTIIREIYAAPFQARKVPFNYFQNILLPDLLLALTLFLGVLYLTGYIIPRLINRQRYALAIFHLLVFGAAIYCGFCVADYFLQQYLYHGPVSGRRSFLRLLLKNFLFTVRIVGFYSLYAVCRETVIRYI